MLTLTIEPELDPQTQIEEFVLPKPTVVETLNRAVHARTSRMIDNLRIEISRFEIVLWGHTQAYYYKQLASHVILEEMPGVTVSNEIEVI